MRPFPRNAGVAADHACLHFDGAANGFHHAMEFDERSIAGALHDASVMGGDGGIDEVAAQPPEPRQGPLLVRAGQPAEADHVGGEDRCKLPALGHSSRPRSRKATSAPVRPEASARARPCRIAA
jgi:hypothetical protein